MARENKKMTGSDYLMTYGWAILIIVIVAGIILYYGMMSTAPTATNTVSIREYSFNPSSITVSVGTTVTWTNDGSMTHTVTSDTGEFSSGNLAPGLSSFTHTFTTAGTYNYHCSIHPSMHGTVIVQ